MYEIRITKIVDLGNTPAYYDQVCAVMKPIKKLISNVNLDMCDDGPSIGQQGTIELDLLEKNVNGIREFLINSAKWVNDLVSQGPLGSESEEPTITDLKFYGDLYIDDSCYEVEFVNFEIAKLVPNDKSSLIAKLWTDMIIIKKKIMRHDRIRNKLTALKEESFKHIKKVLKENGGNIRCNINIPEGNISAIYINRNSDKNKEVCIVINNEVNTSYDSLLYDDISEISIIKLATQLIEYSELN